MFGRHVVLPLLSVMVAACSKSNEPATTAGPPGGSMDASTRDAPATNDAADGTDAGSCTSPDFAGNPLGVHCNALVDTSGRTVLLHGMNARVPGVFDVTFNDGRLPVETIPAFGMADASRIRALGFNALRLPMQWSGVEPTEDGGIQTAYLDNVASVTALCAAAGLFVILDLHQDSYSKEIGEDGAPLWAIVPPPTQLLGGPLTDPSTRFASAQVQDAFETFFGSADAGAVLRTRYTRMAVAVAARFAHDAAVVGFELYNEPFATAPQILGLHQEMIPALRAAAPSKLLFFEPASTRDEFDEAPLGNGSIGAGTVYAPHVYTLAFSSPDELGITKATYAPSNLSARSEADSWAAPLVITEYGYPPSSPNFANWAKWQAELEEQVRASSFFWLWKENSQSLWGLYAFNDAGVPAERTEVVQALTRPRLEAVAGELVSEAFDESSGTMTIVFRGESRVLAPNLVSVGVTSSVPASKWSATCDGKNASTGGSSPLSIACGGNGLHTLTARSSAP